VKLPELPDCRRRANWKRKELVNGGWKNPVFGLHLRICSQSSHSACLYWRG